LNGTDYDVLAAVESRGFLFAAPMAAAEGKKLVILRKPGKLPIETEQVSYDLEYGQATLEVHKDSIKPGERVVIVDDLLATGGTAAASGELIRKLGGSVAGYLFMVELVFLSGSAQLTDGPVFSLVKYD
jgi:adenine phosphoribosyltransferase